VVALSVDQIEGAQKTNQERSISFPIAFGVNGAEFAAQTGAFYDANKGFLQAAGFVLEPEGSVVAALYSTGAVGRYTAADLLRLIDYLEKKAR
jgi:alkyl hydroperoxide reductase subunit AhpC